MMEDFTGKKKMATMAARISKASEAPVGFAKGTRWWKEEGPGGWNMHRWSSLGWNMVAGRGLQ